MYKKDVGWGLQERLERGFLGRLVISLFVIVVIATLVAANLPASRAQRLLLKVDHPFLYGAGLDQNWGMFAPDPRRQTIAWEAKVSCTDGRKTTWKVPSNDSVVGAYRDYHWRKWVEYVSSDQQTDLWEPAATYALRRVMPNCGAATVVLTRRWYNLARPGVRNARKWQAYEYYSHLVWLRR